MLSEITFLENVEIKEDGRSDVCDFLLHCQGDNKIKVLIYNLIKNGAELEVILLFFENNDVDRNLKSAALELLTAER